MIWPNIDDEFVQFGFYLDAVPEPSSAVLAMLGLVAFAGYRRRK